MKVVKGKLIIKLNSIIYPLESGQPKSPLDRDFLTKELNIKEDYRSKSV